MNSPKLWIIGIEESEDCQLKGPANIFNKIMEENLSNLKNEIPTNIQEASRTANSLDQKKKFLQLHNSQKVICTKKE